MRGKRIRETRERHLFAALKGIEERLELGLVRMIADVAAVEHFHRQIAPRVPVQPRQLLRVKFVIENAPLAADEMSVKVIWLQAVNDRGALPGAAAPELQDRGRRGV